MIKINNIGEIELLVKEKFGTKIKTESVANVLYIKIKTNELNHKALVEHIYNSINDDDVKIIHRGYSIIGEDPIWIQVIKKEDNHFEIIES